MSEQNPYTSPDDRSVSLAAEVSGVERKSTGSVLARAVEYLIAILLIIGLFATLLSSV